MKTYLYLISAGGTRAVKIGITADVDARIAQLQTGQSKKLTLLAKFPFDSRSEARALEKALHSKYAEYRLEGEWFRPKVLGMLCEGMGLRYKNRPYGPNQARKTLKEMTLSTHQI